MHNFKFTEETIKDENAVHHDAVNANWFASFEIRKQQSDERKWQACAEKDDAKKNSFILKFK